jgi:hypothetical protein
MIASANLLRFLVRESAETYHARSKDYVTAHALNEFRRCPLLYHKKELGLVPERGSAAFLVGRAAHTLILEGRERYGREYAVGGPVNPRTGKPFGSSTKAFAEWAAQQGRPVLSDDHAALVEQMAASVHNHVVARELLADGVAEGVVRCEYAGHRCQARIDWISSVEDLAAEASGHVLPVHIIAVEKREPFRCGVWEIASGVLDQAQHENEGAMQDLRRCRESGNWFTRFESLRRIDRL